MKQVHLGIIGCGVIGTIHIKAAVKSERLKVVAIADKSEERLRKIANEFGIKKTYSSGEMLLEDPDVEAVVLALPTGIRTPLALQAFRCGKHVLLEKPAAMNVNEIKQMIRARGKLVCACCSARYRFLPSADFATDFIASGALGELRVVRCRVISSAGPPPEKTPPPWRVSKSLNGGGILVNWGVYDLDYLLGITGWSLKPELVLAQTWHIPPQFQCHVAPGSDAEEHFAALIRCQKGTVILFERGECVAAQSDEAWQIIGTKGSLHLRMTSGKGNKIVFDNSSTEHGVFSEVIWEGDEDTGRVHTGPVDNFAGAIRGNEKPKTGLEQALIIQQITDAIYASAEEGKAIKINN
jgi:predicted dehydrogenase